MKLSDNDLFKQQAFINGSWCNADSEQVVEVRNPASGEVIGTVPNMLTDETERAIESCKNSMVSWRSLTGKARANVLRKWFDLIIEHTDDLAKIMTLEQGKPFAEAQGEIKYAASFIEWFGEEGKRTYGDVIPHTVDGTRLMVLQQPIGVCAAITPWNFPAAMITRKAAPALAAGCTFVIRPANETPFSALALAELAQRAGIPDGVFNVVTGQARVIGQALTTHPDVAKFSFTGSTPVGRALAEQCASTIKKVSLELGGNAPFIVFDDADIDAAVEGAMIAKFRNAGQTCVCVNRFYVHEKVQAEFTEKLVAKVSALPVGDGLSPETKIGPLITDDAVDKLLFLLTDATDKGAKIAYGGGSLAQGKRYFAPTVVTDVTPDMAILNDEIFGPIATISTFTDENDVIDKANNTIYGLASYFYTQNLSRTWRVSEALEYGMVGINTGLISNEVAPFGGVKQSGLGREGSKYGIEDYLEQKYLCIGL